MLERPAERRAARQRRPSRRAEIQAAYRRRLANGLMTCRVAVGHEVIGALVRWRWLHDDEAHDPRQVAAAIAAMLTDAAEHK